MPPQPPEMDIKQAGRTAESGRASGREEGAGRAGERGETRPAAGLSGSRRGQQACNLPQFGAGAADGGGNVIQALGGGGSGREQQAGLGIALRGGLRTGAAAVDPIGENLASAGQGVTLGVDQALDFEGQFNVATAVKTLAGTALVGLELGKLRFPEAQDVGFDTAEACDIANLEVETVRDRGLVRNALLGKLCGHGGAEEGTGMQVEPPLSAV